MIRTTSCIIPAYNSARYLDAAIESIRGQTVLPLEIIVVDDGSTDATCRIAERYGSKVRLIRQATAGPAATRNTGIRHANGPFIAFLDADDRWHPEKLEHQLLQFEAQPKLDACISMVQNVWDPMLHAEYHRLRDSPRAQPVPGYISGAMLARRSAFAKVGLFDEELWFADGPEWFMRAKAMGLTIGLLPKVLIYHRIHDGGITRRRPEESKREFLRLVRERINRN